MVEPFWEDHEAENDLPKSKHRHQFGSAIIGLAALVYAIVRDKKKDPEDPEERDR